MNVRAILGNYYYYLLLGMNETDGLRRTDRNKTAWSVVVNSRGRVH